MGLVLVVGDINRRTNDPEKYLDWTWTWQNINIQNIKNLFDIYTTTTIYSSIPQNYFLAMIESWVKYELNIS